MEFEKLRDIIASGLDVDKESITMDTSFVDDLNADSLDLLEVVVAIENEFGINIPDDAMKNIVTVGDAVEQIKAAKN
jgi:acyl carrier protein